MEPINMEDLIEEPTNVGEPTVKSTTGKPTKFGIYEYRPGHFQVNFSYEGKQIHLQKFFGQPLTTDTLAHLVIGHIQRFGWHPEKWGKETPYQFDHAVQTWIKSIDAIPEWKKQLEGLADKLYKPFFKKLDIRKIKDIHIQEFYSTLLDKHYSPKYVKNVMDELKAFLNFYRKSLPTFPDFPRVQVQEKPIRWLSEEEQDKIFLHIPEIDRPIFEFMKHYGCRTNEAGGLLHKNVFLDHTPAYFVIATTLRANGKVKETTKTKTIRILPIIPETRWIFETRGESPFMFTKKGRPYSNCMLNSVWKKANRLSGVQKINLYNGVRHSFACQRLNAGFSIEEVRVMLGHSTSKMTQRYAAYTLQSLENIVRGNVFSPFIPTPETKLLDFKEKPALPNKGYSLKRSF